MGGIFGLAAGVSLLISALILFSLFSRGWEFFADADGECVTPDAETIASGDYPLSRSLYIYVNTAKAEENAAVSGYVDFYLSDLGGFVEAADYVALPDDQAEETQTAWDGR